MGEAVRRQYAAYGGETEDAGTEDTPQHKHGGIANQHTGHADQKHLVYIGKTQTRDDASGDESNVFRDGNSETADQKNEEDGGVTVVSKKCNQDIHRLPVYL